MTISEKKIYPRTGDKETVYLKSVVTNPSIIIDEFTMYNDFVNDPREFEKNNVLYHYPIKHRLTRAHREKQLKMSCQALHNAPPNRT